MALLSKAINKLSLSLYKQLAEDQGNVFFSPFSISTALSMLLCGARGRTEQEMRQALHFEDVSIPNSEVHSCFRDLLSLFSKGSDHITLTFANAILSQKDMSVMPEFKETVENIYRAPILEVDFAGENKKAVSEVNDWVRKSTNDMIKEIVQSLDPSTIMVILNAIYFKGSWKYPFDPECTHPNVFYNRGLKDQGKKVPMMFINKMFGFVEKETYKALELPYENDAIVMLLLLPKDIDGLQNLENLLTADLLRDAVNPLYYQNVEVTLPKLRLEYSKQLSGSLIKLGMVNAFGSSANFSGINDKNICVSEVLTKSVLVVNEEGTEAAAVTADIMVQISMVLYKTFEADHPFLCIIYDKEKDMVLFIGRVLEF